MIFETSFDIRKQKCDWTGDMVRLNDDHWTYRTFWKLPNHDKKHSGWTINIMADPKQLSYVFVYVNSANSRLVNELGV